MIVNELDRFDDKGMPRTRAGVVAALIKCLDRMSSVQSDAAFEHADKGRKEAELRCETRRAAYADLADELRSEIDLLPGGKAELERAERRAW